MSAAQQWPPLVAEGLGKRYSRGWALRECSLTVPANRVVALVGPNGAGKTTLMSLSTGLLKPSTGRVRIFGEEPSGRGTHPKLSFLGQQKPLYSGLTVAESLRLGRQMNPGWDQSYAERLVADAGVPLKARIGTLSGGQRTRVAIALTLGKRPELVLLDEPLADLDPLARQESVRTLLTEARQNGITVILSSHVVAELQGVCDHLVLLGNGRVQLAGDLAQLIHEHWHLTGHNGTPLPGNSVVDVTDLGNGLTQVLVRAHTAELPTGWTPRKPTVEDLVLGYMRSSSRVAVPA
jgi:ABC-2 type transport system ATP-binding protein